MTQSFFLSNGVKVVSEQLADAKSVIISFWVLSGSRNERQEEQGISHFVEHLVFKGNKRRKLYHIANGIESLGGYINAMTDKESTCYYVRVPAEYLERGIDILSDMVFRPEFKLTEIEKEKQVVLDELSGVEDYAEDWIGDLFEEHLFKGHPLAWPVIGKRETIEAFDLQHLNDRVAIHHHPERILIAITGFFQPEKLNKLLEKYVNFSKLETPSFFHQPFVLNGQVLASEKINLDRPINQSHLMLGTFAPSIKDKSSQVGLLINSILGSGMSSRLNLNIREKFGFCYSIYSGMSSYSDISNFYIYAATDPDKIDKVEGLILKELSRFQQDGPTKREFDQIKKSVRGSILISSESMTSRNMGLSRSEFIYGEIRTIEQQLAEVESLQLSDVFDYLKQWPIDHLHTTIRLNGKN